MINLLEVKLWPRISVHSARKSSEKARYVLHHQVIQNLLQLLIQQIYYNKETQQIMIGIMIDVMIGRRHGGVMDSGSD